MDLLLEPFRFEFFRYGAAVTTIAGALCGLVGVYVVLRGMSYIGHGLSHAIFGGAVATFLIGINFYLGAGVWGVASVLMINSVARRRTIGSDAAIGVVTTASFAVGLALISRYRSFMRNFEAALFGN
ncbi:MAG: metal ABC transporter permease, partial [Acidimicrobiia bacterium]